MGSSGSTIAELQAILAKKDERIKELEMETMNLRSELDKYQSVFKMDITAQPEKPKNRTRHGHLRGAAVAEKSPGNDDKNLSQAQEVDQIQRHHPPGHYGQRLHEAPR